MQSNCRMQFKDLCIEWLTSLLNLVNIMTKNHLYSFLHLPLHWDLWTWKSEVNMISLRVFHVKELPNWIKTILIEHVKLFGYRSVNKSLKKQTKRTCDSSQQLNKFQFKQNFVRNNKDTEIFTWRKGSRKVNIFRTKTKGA